jgi:outer membrane protein assembly factor BamB
MIPKDRRPIGPAGAVLVLALAVFVAACSPLEAMARILSDMGIFSRVERPDRSPTLEPEGYTVSWTQANLYSGHNFGDALMVWSGGAVAVLGLRGNLELQRVVAYDGTDGSPLWNAWTGVSSAIAGSPRGVLVGTRDGVVALHESLSGDIVWSTSIRGSGGVLRLAVCGDAVYTYSRPSLFVVLDLGSGTRLPPPATYQIQFPLLLDGPMIVGASSPDTLTALEAASGDVLWAAAIGATFYEQPILAESEVVVRDGRSLGSIVAIDKETGSVAWRSDHIIVSNITRLGHLVLALTTDARLVGFDLNSGEETVLASFGSEAFDLSGQDDIGGYYVAADPERGMVFVLLGDSGQLIALTQVGS